MMESTGLVLRLTAALGMAAMISSPALAQTPKRGGTLVLAIGADPGTLSRNVGSNNADGNVACVLYQGLTRMDSKWNAQPLLAKTWSVSPDGKTYTFELNKAQWQDGKPLTSEDFQYTLLEVSAKYSSVFSGAGKVIDSIDTPAPDKLVIHLKEPYGPFLISLACQQGGAVLPKHVYQGTNPLTNKATLTDPVALGPFLLKEWKHGDYLRLTKNPNYWEPGKPYLDEVIVKVIPQPGSRTQALQAGEVDFIPSYYFALNDYATIKGNPKLMLRPAALTPTVDFIFLNVGRKPVDDRRVRQALFMATDRDYLLHTVYLDLGTVGTMPFTNRLPWADDDSIDYRKLYPFDVAKANALLDEAGLKRGADGIRFKATFLVSSDEATGPSLSQALKSMWRAVGVDLSTESVDRTAATKRVYTDRDYDVTVNAYASFADPALGMARAWVTSSLGKAFGNGSGYSNPEVDQLFDLGEHGTTPAERGVHYRKVQAILARDLPVYTIHEWQTFDGMAKDIHGIEEEQSLNTWRDAWRD